MMTGTLRVFLFVAIAIYFAVLALLVRKGSMSIRYSLLWFFVGFLMLLLTIWPKLLYGFSRLVGISMPVNALYSVAFFCVLILLVSLTSIVSRQNERIKKLVQNQALLEQRIRELEKKLER